ncbi:MAG: hypothetical protein NTY01_19020 [Verrucomicrobia bacterium]|nr:hypothetical protein [Verrucomicrobiota bacterium]
MSAVFLRREHGSKNLPESANAATTGKGGGVGFCGFDLRAAAVEELDFLPHGHSDQSVAEILLCVAARRRKLRPTL